MPLADPGAGPGDRLAHRRSWINGDLSLAGSIEGNGDTHTYPIVPHAPSAIAFLRGLGQGTRPHMLSEYGIGSVMDVIGETRDFEQAGAREDLLDAALIRSMADGSRPIGVVHGLEDLYPVPTRLPARGTTAACSLPGAGLRHRPFEPTHPGLQRHGPARPCPDRRRVLDLLASLEAGLARDPRGRLGAAPMEPPERATPCPCGTTGACRARARQRGRPRRGGATRRQSGCGASGERSGRRARGGHRARCRWVAAARRAVLDSDHRGAIRTGSLRLRGPAGAGWLADRRAGCRSMSALPRRPLRPPMRARHGACRPMSGAGSAPHGVETRSARRRRPVRVTWSWWVPRRRPARSRRRSMARDP